MSKQINIVRKVRRVPLNLLDTSTTVFDVVGHVQINSQIAVVTYEKYYSDEENAKHTDAEVRKMISDIEVAREKAWEHSERVIERLKATL